MHGNSFQKILCQLQGIDSLAKVNLQLSCRSAFRSNDHSAQCSVSRSLLQHMESVADSDLFSDGQEFAAQQLVTMTCESLVTSDGVSLVRVAMWAFGQ